MLPFGEPWPSAGGGLPPGEEGGASRTVPYVFVCVERDEGQNVGRLDKRGSYQKQKRKNRVEKSERSRQTHIQEKWIGQVDCRMSKGEKRFKTHRIRYYWWYMFLLETRAFFSV